VPVLATLRTLLARHPLLYWIVVAAIAALVADIAVGKLHGIDVARRRWGESHDVWISSRVTMPGEAILAEVRAVPVAVVPEGAVADDPRARVALQRLAPGEIVTTADVGDGMLQLLPPEWQGVAFVADETTIPLRIGNHVAVVADGVVVVATGVVIDVTERSVTVGVPAADAPPAALAARTQTAALTLRRP
jgi:hypothetical protein